jgi:hypothetical protein
MSKKLVAFVASGQKISGSCLQRFANDWCVDDVLDELETALENATTEAERMAVFAGLMDPDVDAEEVEPHSRMACAAEAIYRLGYHAATGDKLDKGHIPD